MFRKCLVVFLFFFTAIFSNAQQSYEYIGFVRINDTVNISYKIALTEHMGKVKGYSLTGMGGEHETRSIIRGEYYEDKKELNFRETGIVYTKSPITQDDFCFINTTIRDFTFKKSDKIKADFIGLFSDNTKCVNGELMLSPLEKMEAKFDKVIKKINNSKKVSDSIKEKLSSMKMMDSLNMNILRKDQTLSVFSKSKSVSLIIYDGGKEDGDKINIKVNDKSLLTHFEATNTQKVINLDLIDGKTSIVINAVNEGSIAPNTVIVELKDGDNSIKAMSNLKKGEKTQIDFLKIK
ncbi:hypothetical protein [Aestuariibaculum suncheonense]|uniref:Uncharacterized protein n=1 Tax=Aestuariibaculum suncheonense TaxID=1028745 RepID=A0A8J6UB99_9FLAO|nr:hypothetical protein [Aestuariibaculum suncheonense]MBD0835710.1 hypothetical protein [Aestuariibaculum suncheonense]